MRDILLGHLEALYAFYGEAQGLRIARKHLGWYARDVEGGEAFRTAVNAITTAEAQTALARDWFEARAAGLVLDRAA